jgi:hypothetical protein
MNAILLDALRGFGVITVVAYATFAAYLGIAISRHEAAKPTISKEPRR